MTSPRQNTLPEATTQSEPVLRQPAVGDGAGMWRVARDSVRLDLNPPYAYLLWARDFADTSVVADVDGEVAGFVTGFRRPNSPQTLMVWQVAVDERLRGRGVASRLLEHLVERTDATTLETTITDDNPASRSLFAGLARRHGAEHTVDPLFEADQFPDEDPWKPEFLHRIAPLNHAH
ncbi:MAG TPA: diaminobutyrate acetyltransferase [Segeticoccus sp.]|uniref:diaminobutyrate acetyltransferase n=1 Tax=Segeticoccus sp. TaxID=2706531 RepID=UPI002D80B574|nr:diaminobutyrate acetyltransferase [Segeticoccus sp.]HET8599857.1 diaminobutyrate acetyltransferase [Segeticoccus sp.]